MKEERIEMIIITAWTEVQYSIQGMAPTSIIEPSGPLTLNNTIINN